MIDGIDLKRLSLAKMLENLPVRAVGNGEFHGVFAPFLLENPGTTVAQARSATAIGPWPLTSLVTATLDGKRQAADERACELLAGARVNRLHRRARHLHRIRTRRLIRPFIIDKTQALIFVQRQHDRRLRGSIPHRVRHKRSTGRQHADAPRFSRSGHRLFLS